MRIVGGRLGGRPLKGPRGQDIRPTSDRLRETIFNVLAHRHREALDGGRVLDLFAGTGALALEAISRGAGFAVLVDQGFEARGLIRDNIETLGVGGEAKLLKRDATRLGTVAPFEPFSLVFCDPPYGQGLVPRALSSALTGGWLVPGAIIVAEESGDTPPELPAALQVLDQRDIGGSAIVFARFAG